MQFRSGIGHAGHDIIARAPLHIRTMTRAPATRILGSLEDVEPEQWNRLGGDNPFLQHAFLHALHDTGCADERSGWAPCFITLWSEQGLVGALPLYRKSHSYGEYVFDWAWADAYERHGLRYYPKLLSAIPFTPATGPRLLAPTAGLRRRLLDVALEMAAEELGTYALALDGEKQPCRVRTSNAGQLLFSGMVREDRARLVAADLMRPHFFSGWGIRTVALGEARYNPMSYHDGSIWPHDNALIALGFARYGLKHSVGYLFRGLFDAATYMDLRRLPELFCGFRREKRRGPTLYPVACAPQAWASATPFTLLEAALGLEFDAGRGEIRLRNPRLPEFLNEVVLRDLRLGPSSVDLRVSRHGEEVSLEVLRTRGQIQVSIVLAH